MTSSSEVPGSSDGLSIMAHLWQVLHSVLDDSAPALEALGLTSKAFFLLSAVEEHPFPAELARFMHLPPPTVTYLIKQLEADGFVERRAEPGDLRKFRLVVTERGHRAIASGREALGKVFNARLARLEPEEIGPFDRIIERLARPGLD